MGLFTNQEDSTPTKGRVPIIRSVSYVNYSVLATITNHLSMHWLSQSQTKQHKQTTTTSTNLFSISNEPTSQASKVQT